MTSVEKGAETRRKNQEAQARRFAEQAENIRLARLALQRVFESKDSTSAEILEAARLLTELSRPY